jgi:hypothetical protein
MGLLKCFSFFCFFLLSMIAEAQDWAPVRVGDRYNYSLNHDPLATVTLAIDSFHVNATDSINVSLGDTVFFMNRVMCDSCATHYSIPGICDTCYGLKNRTQFMRGRVRHTASGAYSFRGPGSVALFVNAHLGAAWLYDTTAGIRARIISEDTFRIFGMNDSLKTILLNSGDTVLLSKTYGIIQYPKKYKSHSYYRLIGIDGRNIGTTIPGTRQIYDFNVGDVFEYHDYGFSGNGPVYQFRILKYTISSKRLSGDSLIYHLQGMNFQKQNNINYPILDSWCTSCFSAFSQDRVYVDTLHDIANSVNHQLVKLPLLVPGNTPGFDFIRFGTDSNQLFFKIYGYIQNQNRPFCFGQYNQSDTMIPYSKSTKITPSLCKVLKPGLGQTDMWAGDNFENVTESHLIAWQKGTNTFGTLTPDSLLTGMTELNNASLSYSISPNPFSGQLTIQTSSSTEGVVELMDLWGRVVLRQPFQGTELRMDTGMLAKGVYTISLQCGKAVFCRKLVKFLSE